MEDVVEPKDKDVVHASLPTADETSEAASPTKKMKSIDGSLPPFQSFTPVSPLGPTSSSRSSVSPAETDERYCFPFKIKRHTINSLSPG
jgi:hypothetical protein